MEIYEVIKVLANYLQAKIPRLRKVYSEWPNPSGPLALPSLSVISGGKTEITHEMPVMAKKNGNRVLYITGEYNLPIQLDLWTEYKAHRAELFSSIHALFQGTIKGDIVQGIGLKIPNYFDTIARYELVDYNVMDSELYASKGEWRMTMMVESHFNKLREIKQPLMKKIILEPTYNEQKEQQHIIGEEA